MIRDILRQRRDIILKKWKEDLLGQYFSGNLKINDNDRFGNPVAYSISSGLKVILDETIAGTRTARLHEALEDIVKIKSLEVEKPSIAVDFLFRLKVLIRSELADCAQDGISAGEMEKLNADIDNLTLSAFDIFMKCREKLYEIRSKEFIKRSYKLLERANMAGPALRQKGEVDDEIE